MMFRRRRFGELIVFEIGGCERCELSSSSVKCIDCSKNLCYSCAHDLHYKGSWRIHQLCFINYGGIGEESSHTCTLDSSSSESSVSSSFIDGNYDEGPGSIDSTLDGRNKQTIFDAISSGNLILFVEIEDYEELHCARLITSHFDNNNTVQAALSRIASKGNVCIDVGSSESTPSNYELFFVDFNGDYMLMEKSRTLGEYKLTYKQTIKLRNRKSNWIQVQQDQQKKEKEKVTKSQQPLNEKTKRKSWIRLTTKTKKSKEKKKNLQKLKHLNTRLLENLMKKKWNDQNSTNNNSTSSYENKIILSVEIEDYEVLKCVRKFSDFFDINSTALDAIFQIAKKNSVCLDLSNERDNFFQLYLSSKSSLIKLDKTKKLSQCGLTHRDSLILKMLDD